MKYVASKFNHAIKHKNKLYIFNNVTGSIIGLNDIEKYSLLVQSLGNNLFALDKKSILIENNISDDELKMLIDNGFYVNSTKTEKKYFWKKVEEIKNKKEKVITFLFTENCNFRCPYCFQEHVDRKLSKNLIDDCIKFIGKIVDKEDVEDLEITYYGGEPLLEKDNLLYTHKHLNLIFNEKIKSYNLITNGYLMNEEFLEAFYNISDSSLNKNVSIQVTVDGVKEVHNKRRFLSNGEGTFEKIINNINIATKYFFVIIRINIDKLSIDYLLDLAEELDSKITRKDNVILSPDFVSVGTSSNKNYRHNVLVNDFVDFSKIRKFKEVLLSNGFKLSTNNEFGNDYGDFPLGKPKYVYCPAVSGNQLIFSSDGNIFTCLEHVSNLNYRVGNLYDNPIFNSNYDMWQKYNIGNFEECEMCEFNLFCAGGCPSKYLNESNILKPSCNKSIYTSKIDKLLY